MTYAASSGNLSLLRWLHETQHEGFTTHTMDLTAAKGYLSVVQWLHLNRQEGCSFLAMDCAAANGHLHVVQWLHKNPTGNLEGCTTDAMYNIFLKL